LVIKNIKYLYVSILTYNSVALNYEMKMTPKMPPIVSI